MFSKVCINFSPALQGGGWEVGREEAKTPQVKTRGPELPTEVLTIQPGRRDIIPVKGRIPG